MAYVLNWALYANSHRFLKAMAVFCMVIQIRVTGQVYDEEQG
jgi:hypothetical protein